MSILKLVADRPVIAVCERAGARPAVFRFRRLHAWLAAIMLSLAIWAGLIWLIVAL